jgi:hypothetical protein
VKFIGLDKSGSTSTAGLTSIIETEQDRERDIQTILARFPRMVSCNGSRTIKAGKHTIANWRFQRG